MSLYHDETTLASEPGGITLSDAKLKRFHPAIYTRWARILGKLPPSFPVQWFGTSSRWRDIIEEHIRLGDGRAALVVRVEPLIVAAYTDEFDCAALLRFDPWVQAEYNLRVSDRLLTVNTYTALGDGPPATDLVFGPRKCGQWADFWPIIADFLADDRAELERRKSRITDDEWERTKLQAERLVSESRWAPRDGAPMNSRYSAAMLQG